MTLQNLLSIKRLQAHVADGAAVRKLLEAARRNLTDAQVTAIGADLRFDAAYKCVMQCAMLGLWASGYRTVTSQPGHHQTAIQSLGLTMGVPSSAMIILDGLRKQRHLSDYAGDPVSDAALAACIAHAAALMAHTEAWLQDHHPALLATP